MKPKLKENPREWQKFILTGVLVLGGSSLLLWRRGSLSSGSFEIVSVVLSTVFVLSRVRPHWFRLTYRAAMTVSFYVGQVMGRVLLAMFFVLALTPLALAMRLLGKDLLRLKRDAKTQSYWRPAKVSQDFDRQF